MAEGTERAEKAEKEETGKAETEKSETEPAKKPGKETRRKPEASEEKRTEFVARFKEFIRKKYYKEMVKAANEEKALEVDFQVMEKYSFELADFLLNNPGGFYSVVEEAIEQTEKPGPVKVRFSNLPKGTSIRDLRSKHIKRFLSIEGTVRRASEIRPEIMKVSWECPECGDIIERERIGNVIPKIFGCKCGNKSEFKKIEEHMIDTRWITVEEPFELTEGERPSQVTVLLTDDLVSPDGRRLTDPGNRIKITGVLKDIPRGGKFQSAKLDFYMDANHVEPIDIGWHHLEISKEDVDEIKNLAKSPRIYDTLVESVAPSLYGLREIKESILMQLFGGVSTTLNDGTHIRGDIHILLVGDPASGKSQLLKLVPDIVPRGRYVSGKGVTGAGLCMSYDTLVPLAHGEIVKIGDVVEDSLSKGKNKIEQGWVSTKGDTEVLCLDPTDLKIKKKKVSKFFKLKPTGKLVGLKTGSGRRIKLTRENPVLVISGGELAWKQAKDVRVNEYVATARNIPINHLNVEIQPEFARFAGMVAGDGDIGKREVRFHNTNKKYLNEFSKLSSSLGFRPREYYQSARIPCIRVASKTLCDNLDKIGIPRGIKSDRIVIPEDILRSNELLSEFLSGLFICDGGPVEKGNGSYIEYTTTSMMMAMQIQTSLLRFGILSKMRERSPGKGGFGAKKKRYVIIIRGQENLKRFESEIGFSHDKKEKLSNILKRGLKPNTNIDVIPNIGKKIKEIRKSLGITIKSDDVLYMLRGYERGDRKFSREQLLKFNGLLKEKKNHTYFNFLDKLSKSDIFWDPVKEKKDVQEEWVYDLTVEDEHNFVANDFIVHNTATVTKDEQFMGGWVLEAGALVLTNRGLLSVDEFEKMAPDDMIAMHEALEQGTISIAKASIVATLPARTSVLAGGNPKFSRFDPYVPISKQITIPDTLLTRFDLKFAMRDIPDAEKDTLIAEHVIQTRHDENYEPSKPKLSQDFIRKYIAYARENYKPKMTKDVGKILKKFYITTRKRAEGSSAPVPITMRQLEALMRIAQASAKIQLQNEIRKEDAQRAIRLMKYSLQQLGFDPETGMIDVDRSEGGVTSAERSRIRIVLDIVNEMSETKKELLVDEILKAAKKEGVDDADEVLEKLKREGMLFEPSPGYVQKV